MHKHSGDYKATSSRQDLTRTEGANCCICWRSSCCRSDNASVFAALATTKIWGSASSGSANRGGCPRGETTPPPNHGSGASAPARAAMAWRCCRCFWCCCRVVLGILSTTSGHTTEQRRCRRFGPRRYPHGRNVCANPESTNSNTTRTCSSHRRICSPALVHGT